ncbi:MAG TPA: BON domain-containing protein [Candidatus Dormibacteraeota bacterium]|jgi:osmotically-inducible protein OsmY|nr:BON domain-containing protein [Candidatus Dormibacteraeota bacterium]
MNSNKKSRGALSAAVAAAAVLTLGGCDQIRSWFSSAPPPAAQQAPAQQGAIEVAKAKPAEAPKPVEPPPVDENKVLAGKVKSALGADPALKLLAIDAGASDGVVTLYGTADNKRNRDKAARVAAGVPGVKSVKNELVIVAGS